MWTMQMLNAKPPPVSSGETLYDPNLKDEPANVLAVLHSSSANPWSESPHIHLVDFMKLSYLHCHETKCSF